MRYKCVVYQNDTIYKYNKNNNYNSIAYGPYLDADSCSGGKKFSVLYKARSSLPCLQIFNTQTNLRQTIQLLVFLTVTYIL